MCEPEIRVCGRAEGLIKGSEFGVVALLVDSFFVEEYQVRWVLYGDLVSAIIRGCDGEALAFGYIFDVAPATPETMKQYLPLSGGYTSVKEWVTDTTKKTNKIPSHVILVTYTKRHAKLRIIQMREKQARDDVLS